MFYAILADGPKDNDAQLNGPYKTVETAKRAMRQGDFEGPVTFTIIELIVNGHVRIVSIGRLPEYPNIEWRGANA